MIAYVDSSILLRIVLGQSNSLVEWPQLQHAIASELVEVECLRTMDRIRLHGRIQPEALAIRRETVFSLLNTMRLVAVSRAILVRASQPCPTPLGTLDAIHLATALAVREADSPSLTMATHDAALGLAARASGLPVIGA
jgi:predicted nucleic acid-binding protein